MPPRQVLHEPITAQGAGLGAILSQVRTILALAVVCKKPKPAELVSLRHNRAAQFGVARAAFGMSFLWPSVTAFWISRVY